MTETPRWLDIPWVKEQVKAWLNIQTDDVKWELENLQKDVVAQKLKDLDFSWFNKWKTQLNGAAHIALVQRALNLIPGNNTVTVDGIYGPATKAAIEAFQSSDKWGSKITQDGIPGNDTKNKLIAALGVAPWAAPATVAATPTDTPAQKVEKAKNGVLPMLEGIGITWVQLEDDWKSNKERTIFTNNFKVWKRTLYVAIIPSWLVRLEDATDSSKESKGVNKDGSLTDKRGDTVTLEDVKQVLQAIQKSENTAPASAPAAAAPAKPLATPDAFPTGIVSMHGLTITVPTTKPDNTGGTGADEYKEWWTLDNDKKLQWSWTRVFKNGYVDQGLFKNDLLASGIGFLPGWISFVGTYTPKGTIKEGIYTYADGGIFKGNFTPEGTIKEGIYTYADGKKEQGTFDAELKLYNGSKFDKDGKKIADYKDGKEVMSAPASVTAPAAAVTPAAPAKPAATPAAVAPTQAPAPAAKPVQPAASAAKTSKLWGNSND